MIVAMVASFRSPHSGDRTELLYRVNPLDLIAERTSATVFFVTGLLLYIGYLPKKLLTFFIILEAL